MRANSFYIKMKVNPAPFKHFNTNMFYVYLIRFSLTNKLYFGFTKDLRKRVEEHKKKGNLELIYYEAYKSEKDAKRREYNIKYFGKAYGQLKGRIKSSLEG